MRLLAAAPLLPESFGRGQRRLRIDRIRRRPVRRSVGEDHRRRLAGLHVEFGERLEIAAEVWNRRMENDHVGTGDRAKGSVRETVDPRDSAAVIESQHELHLHSNATAIAAYEA